MQAHRAPRCPARSGLRSCILRLSAVMPARLPSALDVFLEELFAVPLNVRCEVVVDLDVATACLNAAEALAAGGGIAGRVFLIGGGERNGCQMRAREMFQGLLGTVGLPVPRSSLFAAAARSAGRGLSQPIDIRRVPGR